MGEVISSLLKVARDRHVYVFLLLPLQSINESYIGMDIVKNQRVQYGTGTSKMVRYFHGTLLHYYYINCDVNSNV